MDEKTAKDRADKMLSAADCCAREKRVDEMTREEVEQYARHHRQRADVTADVGHRQRELIDAYSGALMASTQLSDQLCRLRYATDALRDVEKRRDERLRQA